MTFAVALVLLAQTVPPDWKVEVLARSPELRHPTVVCASPSGRIFVGSDPQDMEGPVDAKIGRVLCVHPDGRVTVFAENLGAVFGIQYLDGKVYVHHVPKLTVYRDADGVGKDPVDLFPVTHPEPSRANRYNTHIPANFRLGIDGRLYMAVGDKGLLMPGFTMRGGGAVRFKPDGSELEVVATGTRNLMDLAITADGELFAWDNDDNVRWAARILHLVQGGDYGYPWDDGRPWALGSMADPRGIPAGGVAYEEDGLPQEYRGDLFFCEWGRSQVVRMKMARDGATWKIVSREPIFERDTEEFRPVGIAVSPDGSGFLVADWNTAARLVKQEAGRLLRFTWTGKSPATPRPTDPIAALSHPALSVRQEAQRRLADRRPPELAALLADPTAPTRARIHALWALEGSDAVFAAAKDPDPALRRQAMRQLGFRKRGSELLVAALRDPEPTVRLDAASALARIADPKTAPALAAALDDADGFVRHVCASALRSIGFTDALARAIRDDRPRRREGALFALREMFDPRVVTLLAEAGQIEAVAELHRKDPPWNGTWWGTRPALNARPPRTVDWEGTPVASAAMRSALEGPHAAAAARAVRAAHDAGATAAVRNRFSKESDAALRLELFRTLEALKDPEIGPLASALVRDAVRDDSLFAAAARIAGPAAVREALERETEPARLLPLLDALGRGFAVLRPLSHRDPEVRRRAIAALGRSGDPAAVEPLLRLRDPEAIAALAKIPDLRALDAYLEGMEGRNPELRAACRQAVAAIADAARPVLEPRAETLPGAVVAELQRIYPTGPISRRKVDRPDPAAFEAFALASRGEAARGRELFMNPKILACGRCHVIGGQGGDVGPDLSIVGAIYGRAYLIESILHPSRIVAGGYRQAVVQTRDGAIFSGVVKRDSADELILQDGEGNRRSIRKDGIAGRKVSTTSIMPEGLTAGLTLQEFADLIAYLESLRQE